MVDDVAWHQRMQHRVTLVHAIFDSLSEHDMEFFESLGRESDIIIATIPSDKALYQTDMAAGNQDDRLELAASIPIIDFVILTDWSTAEQSITGLRPNDFAVPPTPNLFAQNQPLRPTELEVLSRLGIELRTYYRQAGNLFEHRQKLAKGASNKREFMDQLLARYSLEEITAGVESLREKRVLVIGESIIDEYAYCNAMGKSGKEPMLVTRFVGCDAQAGGALAIANHLAEFSDHVSIISALGHEDSREEFIRKSLNPTIDTHFFIHHESPTIIKRRYIDAYTLAKMFGVYSLGDQPLKPDDEEVFCQLISQIVPSFDLVIVADYGHGLMTPRAINLITSEANFLAVNTQINAANQGYNTLSKYPRVDFACLHEGELRLDARDLHGDLHTIIEATATRLDIPTLLVTLGKAGTLLYNQNQGFSSCPALATAVVERVGAGDAVLSLASLGAMSQLPDMVINLLANLAGAQAVAVLGNSASIRKAQTLESIRMLLSSQTKARLIEGQPKRILSHAV
jgi:bifunctional ADP-heptose synthase (sugar kinase/adenylyltransferase)